MQSVYKKLGVRNWMDGWMEAARRRAIPPAFEGWEMARSQWAARVRKVVYYVYQQQLLFCEVVCMYIHQGALVQ